MLQLTRVRARPYARMPVSSVCITFRHCLCFFFWLKHRLSSVPTLDCLCKSDLVVVDRSCGILPHRTSDRIRPSARTRYLLFGQELDILQFFAACALSRFLPSLQADGKLLPSFLVSLSDSRQTGDWCTLSRWSALRLGTGNAAELLWCLLPRSHQKAMCVLVNLSTLLEDLHGRVRLDKRRCARCFEEEVGVDPVVSTTRAANSRVREARAQGPKTAGQAETGLLPVSWTTVPTKLECVAMLFALMSSFCRERVY